MLVETFEFDTPCSDGSALKLKMAAKRYLNPHGKSRDGLTILACHGLGQHKEQWEPVITTLFRAQTHLSPRLQIREVWAFDWQTHGESAVLNQLAIEQSPKSARLDAWGAAVASFIKSGLVDGHRLVGLAYSAGAVALLLSTKHFKVIPFLGMILIDPSMMDADTWSTHQRELQAMFDFVKKGATMRLDSWTTKSDAHKYLKKRVPYKTWDERILESYIEYALYETMGEDGKQHVKRKCSAMHEASFKANLEITWEAMAVADQIQHLIPIHMVLGTGAGTLPPVVRACVIDKSKGRRYASISYIPDVGHMILQVNPDAVADLVSSLLPQILPVEATARL